MKAALIAALLFVAAPALAQETPQTRETWDGLTVAEITGQLTAAGLTVTSPLTNADRVYLRVEDGPLRWVVTLFSCTDGACPDLQFTATFTGVNATPEIIDRWNGDRRFVKAFYAVPEEEGSEGRAVAQYDVLLSPGAGPAQLDDHIQVWRSLAVDLGRTVTAPAGPATTPPAAPPAQ